MTESLEKKKKNNHRVADVNPTLSNYIKCKQTEHTNQKSEIGRMDWKLWLLYVPSVTGPLYTIQRHSLKIKGKEKECKLD